MKAITGVFASASDARRAYAQLSSIGLKEDRITVVTPNNKQADVQSVPTIATEQPGMGKTMGAVLGAAAGISSGPLILATLIPGVGPITIIGLLGGAIAGAAGAGIGATIGEKSENALTRGLPEDEIFVYEDALRKGRSIVIALASDDKEASRIRELLKVEGAEALDAAREQWWTGLRSAEQAHYSSAGRNFGEDEKFYRCGFEAALHARMRCKEYDQALAEMSVLIEDLQSQFPDKNVADPFRRGYERGRDYYQQLCREAEAA